MNLLLQPGLCASLPLSRISGWCGFSVNHKKRSIIYPTKFVDSERSIISPLKFVNSERSVLVLGSRNPAKVLQYCSGTRKCCRMTVVRAKSSMASGGIGFYDSQPKGGIFSAAAITVIFAVANRVLYKMALVPLKDYPFFLAQLTTFGYVAVYFSILYFRYRMGIVTDEMLKLPKWRFIAIGALEALGVASGMAAAVHLPGALIPVLSQTFLVWQLIFSVVLLKRRYAWNQTLGCFMVAVGVAIAVTSGAKMDVLSEHLELLWPFLMLASASFQAGASILKESIFLEAAKCLKGGSVDIFVVNSFGSGFQALFVLLLLPFLSSLKGIPFARLPIYFEEGTACLVNMGTVSDDCQGAPLLPILFILGNILFNISLLSLVKMSSAVVASLSVTLSVPLSIFAFTFDLPYVGAGSSLAPTFIIGAAILVIGLLMYNLPKRDKKIAEKID